MKKSIKKHVIARILDNPIEASENLGFLCSVVSTDRDFYEKYSRKKLQKKVSLYLDDFNLVGKNFKIKNIDSITKIIKDIKKVLIERINIILQKKDIDNIYELTSLVYTLSYLDRLAISELIINEKVLICYELANLIADNLEDKEAIKRFERLKKLNFN